MKLAAERGICIAHDTGTQRGSRKPKQSEQLCGNLRRIAIAWLGMVSALQIHANRSSPSRNLGEAGRFL